jgi:aminoglycoside phosphotransferase (APT) family kinase protein
MARVCGIDVEYGRGEGPASLIAKFPTTVEANLGVALHFDIYRREVSFFRQVAPLCDVSVPGVLLAEAAGPDDFVILMEDMAGYRTGDQVAGCTPEEAEACIDQLAVLHARFWNQVDDPVFEFAFLHAPSKHSTGMHQAAVDGWSPMIANFGADVPDALEAARQRYLDAVPAMQLWMASDPITFVHGDFRMDNLLFGTAPDHAPVVVLDWQGVLRSKGVQDVAYFLSQSIDPAQRRAHERDLVERWRTGLEARGVTGYDAAQAWWDYRAAVLYLWVYVTVIAGALDPSNDRGRQFMSVMIRRAAAAIDELDCLELLPDFE